MIEEKEKCPEIKKESSKIRFSETVAAAKEKLKGLILSDIALTKRELYEKVVRVLISAAILLGSAFMSSGVYPTGIYPVGIALISAFSDIDLGKFRVKKTGALVMTGAVLGGLLYKVDGIIYIIVMGILVLTRTLLRKSGESEPVILRVALSAVGALTVGISSAALHHFRTAELFGALMLGILTPVFTYLFIGLSSYESAEKPFKTKAVYFEAALYTVAFSLLWAIRELTVFGLSFGTIVCVIFTLYNARRRGALYGAVSGIIAGATATNLLFLPVLAIMGFFGGVFFGMSGGLAISIGCVTGLGYLIYAGGYEGLSLIAPEILIASVIFYPFTAKIVRREEESGMEYAEITGKESRKSEHKKLLSLASAFSMLSEEFYILSKENSIVRVDKIEDIINEVCTKHCAFCKKSGDCWTSEKSASFEMVSRFSAVLSENGAIKRSDIPEYLIAKCKKVDAIITDINEKYSKMAERSLREDKTGFLAAEYNTVSKLLIDAAEDGKTDLEDNPVLRRKTENLLKEMGVPYSNVLVYGARRVRIDVYGIRPKNVKTSAKAIRTAFEKELDMEFEEPEFIMLDRDVLMRITRRRVISLECAKATRKKKGETQNGDSAGFFESDSDRFYSLVCDGMGSGAEASVTSRLASIFIERLLLGASSRSSTLEMLNGFLIAKNEECFTTVDLLEIDTLTGEGTFMKAGAASSYIVRDGIIFKVASETPPAGIVYNMVAEETKVKLKKGDTIVMISDGICAGEEDAAWLVELLTFDFEQAPSSFARKILDGALERKGRSDDMTVSVMRAV